MPKFFQVDSNMKAYYSPLEQYRVLQAVEEQCGLYGERLVLLDVDNLESFQISRYCRLLRELEMIDITTYQDMREDFHYPIRLTTKGMDFLAENRKAFWEQAERLAADVVKHWTGFDVSNAAQFFRAAAKKYRYD